MIRAIGRGDESEVRARAGKALGMSPGRVALAWSADRLRAINGAWSDGLYSSSTHKRLESVGIVQGDDEWCISASPEARAVANPPEDSLDPAFPTDGGVEGPSRASEWHPTWYVPSGTTCPFCDAPVLPCEPLNPSGPACHHARWRPARRSVGGSTFAHVECVESAEARDGAVKAYREWEASVAEETRAWELAKLATELRLRAERTYQEAVAAPCEPPNDLCRQGETERKTS